MMRLIVAADVSHCESHSIPITSIRSPARSHGPDSSSGLGSVDRANSPGDLTKVGRAVAEWADGDSVAAHYGYANELFCTQDRAARAGRRSVMHPAQRSWLHRVYGVEFV